MADQIHGKKAFLIKLPKKPSSETNFVLIQLLEKADLIEKDPHKNAVMLCDHLTVTVEKEVLIEMAKELALRFPT